MKTDKQAFPESCTNEGHRANVDSGMTLRDYFAAKAMQAIIQSSGTPTETEANGWGSVNRIEEYSKKSYLMADAMLKQREL